MHKNRRTVCDQLSSHDIETWIDPQTRKCGRGCANAGSRKICNSLRQETAKRHSRSGFLFIDASWKTVANPCNPYRGFVVFLLTNPWGAYTIVLEHFALEQHTLNRLTERNEHHQHDRPYGHCTTVTIMRLVCVRPSRFLFCVEPFVRQPCNKEMVCVTAEEKAHHRGYAFAR